MKWTLWSHWTPCTPPWALSTRLRSLWSPVSFLSLYSLRLWVFLPGTGRHKRRGCRGKRTSRTSARLSRARLSTSWNRRWHSHIFIYSGTSACPTWPITTWMWPSWPWTGLCQTPGCPAPMTLGTCQGQSEPPHEAQVTMFYNLYSKLNPNRQIFLTEFSLLPTITMNSGLYNKPIGKVSPPGHDRVRGIHLRRDFSALSLCTLNFKCTIWQC